MCTGGCGKSSPQKSSNSYTPKKATASPTARRVSGGNPFATKANGFGAPSVKMSFSSKNRSR